MVLFLIPLLLLCLIALVLWAPFHIAVHWPSWTGRKRAAVLAIVFAAIITPYAGWKFWEYRFVMGRVPEPLKVAAIEYREEQNDGIGPGGNENGFVVYRLTDESARWARSQGAALGSSLRGGWRSPFWLATPVDDTGKSRAMWHSPDSDDRERKRVPHPADINEFLSKYGFHGWLRPALRDEINHSLRTQGSIYAYGPGGAITIIAPMRGKVYFGYVG